MPSRLRIPKFTKEADEAEWWFKHHDKLTKAFKDAARRGELRTGTAAKLAQARAAGVTPTTTIRLDPDDLLRARALAAKRGLRYQTYLKMLLHQALDAEEKKLAS